MLHCTLGCMKNIWKSKFTDICIHRLYCIPKAIFGSQCPGIKDGARIFFVARQCFKFFNFAVKRAAQGACCLGSKCPVHSEATERFCLTSETETAAARSCCALFITLPRTKQSCLVHRSESHLRWTWNHSWWQNWNHLKSRHNFPGLFPPVFKTCICLCLYSHQWRI